MVQQLKDINENHAKSIAVNKCLSYVTYIKKLLVFWHCVLNKCIQKNRHG